MRNKIFGLLMAVTAILGTSAGMGIVNAVPASASTCALSTATNPTNGRTYAVRNYSHDYINSYGDLASRRAACANTWITGDPNGWWQFNVRVQDTVDICPSGVTYHGGVPYQTTCDDGGYAAIEFNAFNTGWQTAAADTNSVDNVYNDGNGLVTYTSSWHNFADGDTVPNYLFRYSLVGHFKILSGSYQYYTNWSGSWVYAN